MIRWIVAVAWVVLASPIFAAPQQQGVDANGLVIEPEIPSSLPPAGTGKLTAHARGMALTEREVGLVSDARDLADKNVKDLDRQITSIEARIAEIDRKASPDRIDDLKASAAKTTELAAKNLGSAASPDETSKVKAGIAAGKQLKEVDKIQKIGQDLVDYATDDQQELERLTKQLRELKKIRDLNAAVRNVWANQIADYEHRQKVAERAKAQAKARTAAQGQSGAVAAGSSSEHESRGDDRADHATGPRDTGSRDTGPRDTGPRDTGPRDTGPRDTGPKDSSSDRGPEIRLP